jgi:predicted AAA+ superfamily ATPase
LSATAWPFANFSKSQLKRNGKTLNFAKLGRDLAIDPKTVESYFQILEDTLVGFFLHAYHHSTRKSVKLQPKFYLFDVGIKRALGGELHRGLSPKTPAFGDAFEHFVICEIVRHNSYSRSDFKLFHYQTSAGGEIDLVLKRGREVLAVEIKSTSLIDEVEVRKLARVAAPIKPTHILRESRSHPLPTERSHLSFMAKFSLRDFCH